MCYKSSFCYCPKTYRCILHVKSNQKLFILEIHLSFSLNPKDLFARDISVTWLVLWTYFYFLFGCIVFKTALTLPSEYIGHTNREPEKCFLRKVPYSSRNLKSSCTSGYNFEKTEKKIYFSYFHAAKRVCTRASVDFFPGGGNFGVMKNIVMKKGEPAYFFELIL